MICEVYEAKKAALVVIDVTVIETVACCKVLPTSFTNVPAFLSCLDNPQTLQYTNVSSAPKPERRMSFNSLVNF